MSRINLVLICLMLSCASMAQHKTQETLHFPNALIYEYTYQGVSGELWLFHNPQTGQWLYTAPGDDMLDAVISFPDGTYTSYFQTEDGRFLQQSQHISLETERQANHNEVLKIDSIKREYFQIDDKKIAADAFKILYQKSDPEIIWTFDLPGVNAYQFYGFYRLEGDARINLPIDYSYFLEKNQWIAGIDNPYFQLKLIAYEYNPYEIDISKYKSTRTNIPNLKYPKNEH